MEWTADSATGRSAKPEGLRLDHLPAENARLRELLSLSGINADRLLVESGIIATDNAAAMRLQQLLLDESHHRSKNLLAVVMAITSQTMKNSRSLEHARVAIEHRLSALSRAQDILVQVNWSTAKLADVIRAAIEPFDDEATSRFDLDANLVSVDGRSILPIKLSLNELCTNAVKYGALSSAKGRVEIVIQADFLAHRFKLRWIETGGPHVLEPTRRNFGTKLIRVLAKQLDGAVRLSYKVDGFQYELDAPITAPRLGHADAWSILLANKIRGLPWVALDATLPWRHRRSIPTKLQSRNA